MSNKSSKIALLVLLIEVNNIFIRFAILIIISDIFFIAPIKLLCILYLLDLTMSRCDSVRKSRVLSIILNNTNDKC